MEMGDIGNCTLCELPINSKMNFCKEVCGHFFHRNCLFQSISVYSKSCPRCKNNQSVTPNDVMRDVFPLDFGDDYQVSRLNSAHAVLGRIVSPPQDDYLNDGSMSHASSPIEFTSNYKHLSTMLQNHYAEIESKSLNEQRGLRGMFDGIFSKFRSIENKEERYGLELETDPLILIQHRVEASTLINKDIDMKTIIKRRITLETLLTLKYNLLDLILLRTTYNDLLTLGFNAKMWKRHSHLLPFIDTIYTFRMQFYNVFYELCQGQLEKFVLLQLDVNAMKLLNVSASVLMDCGMDKHALGAFKKIKMTDWCNVFGLTSTHLWHLGISIADVQNILYWSTNIEKDSAFKITFKDLFKMDIENLNFAKNYS